MARNHSPLLTIGRITVFVLFVLGFWTLSGQAATSFIPAPNRVDMVHDPLRNILYITSGSDVLRYNLDTQQFVTPFPLGGNLMGIDLSPDASTLAVADNSTTAIYLVDLQTEANRKVTFPNADPEDGAFSVAFGKDGRILITTGFKSSGWTPLRRYDPATDETKVVSTGFGVRHDTMLSTSADGQVIAFAEANISNGPWGRYRVSDGEFVERTGYNDGTSAFNYEIATSRNGSQFAIQNDRGTYIYNEDFLRIATFGQSGGHQPIGAIYHPLKDIVYTAWSRTSELRAFETETFRQVATYDAGYSFQNPAYHTAYTEGRLKISRDGSLLFATVEDGIQITRTEEDALPAYGLTVNVEGNGKGFITASPAGIYCPSVCEKNYTAGQQVTLTAVPAPGAQFNGWSESGCSEQGSCTVTMDQAKMVTASFRSTGGSTNESGTFIPAPNRIDMVHDPVRNILYITSGSDVLRYNLDTQQFLIPFPLGGNLMGIDLSPDGNTLAVADNSNPTIHLVDLRTEASRKVIFPNAGPESGVFSVAFGKDGRILITTGVNGSGWIPLRRYDPATGETNTLPGVGQDTMLSASADGAIIGFAESRSDGPWGRYRVSDGDFVERTGYADGTSAFNYEIAGSRNGSQFAIQNDRGTYIYNGDFLRIATFGQSGGPQPIGAIYHPLKDIVYTAWSGTSELRAFETETFRQVATYEVGHTWQNTGHHAYLQGRLKISRNGSLLFATVGGGIRCLNTETDALPAYKLTVNVEGNGRGIVAASPAGIYCPSICEKNYTAGRQVTLTAVPAPGAQFDGWSGGGCSGEGICTTTMDQAKAVTANFRSTGVVDHSGIFIPVPNRVDMVHDPLRNILYITSETDVLRYSLDTQQFLAPFPLGGSLMGIDLSPDANTLVVADNSTAAIYLVDLQSGTSRKVYFPNAASESCYFSVAFGKDGRFLITTGYKNSSSGTLRRYDPATGETKIVSSMFGIPPDTMLAASADGSVIGFAELGSDGAWGRYRVSDGDFVERTGYTDGTSATNFDIAANRNGRQFAVTTDRGAYIYNAVFRRIATLEQFYSRNHPIGSVYHPLKDIVYSAWAGTTEVRAFETETFRQVATYEMGYTFQNPDHHVAYAEGRLKISRDGSLLFATVEGGIHCVSTEADPLPAYRLTVNVAGAGKGFVTASPSGIYCPSVCETDYAAGGMVTLTAAPAPGSDFYGWSETGCFRQRSCTVTMNQAKTVTASFQPKGFIDGFNTVIPVPNRVDLVHDPLRNILYVTSGSDVVRYNLNTQQFLAPFRLGGYLMGLDLSPDANTLAVADNSSPTIHLVDLRTETSRKVNFPNTASESGAFSVAFGSDGGILIATGFNGPGDVPLLRYDPVTGEIKTLSVGVGVHRDTMLSASADGGVIGYTTSNIFDGRWGRYRVSDGDFVVERPGYDGSWFNYEIAANRDGSQFALSTYGGTYIYDVDFLRIATLGGYTWPPQPVGAVYHPFKDIVYSVRAGTTEVLAFETETFRQIATYEMGYPHQYPGNSVSFTQGRLKISRDGLTLFAMIDGGISYSDTSPSKLAVNLSVPSGGIVKSIPGGIDCPSTCIGHFDADQEVTLIALPNPGARFLGWFGEGCSGTGPCSLNVNGERIIGAAFFLLGDVNGDGTIDLSDAIRTVQILTDKKMTISPWYSQWFLHDYKEAEVNSDGRIGLEEMIYILQKVADLR